MVRIILLFHCLCTVQLVAHCAHAIEAGMPNPPASPTVVNVGIFVADVIRLDEVEESFEMEMILLADWMDPRLAFDPESEGTPVKIYQGPYQFNEVYSAWWPQLVILNEIGLGDVNAVKIEVYPEGRVRYKEQRNVTLETPMNLRRFPFDMQTLNAYFVPFGDKSEQVVFEVDSLILGATEEYAEQEKRVNIAEWDLLNVAMETGITDYRYFGETETVSQLKLSITMKRKSNHIFWTIIFPMVVLVSLMWATFWMDIEALADRLNIAFIGILTIVAYQFLINDSMPRIAYLSFTDGLLLCSFLIMASTIAQSIFVFSMVQKGRRKMAHNIDVVSRWAFPGVHLLTVALNYYFYVVRDA